MKQIANGSAQWDDLILVVYSVLVGLSLDKNFDFFAHSETKLSSAILLVGIFIVVLENWIYLPVYLRVIDIDTPEEVVLYLFAVISYSCIPALYLANAEASVLTPAEWILLNFALICLVDALSKLKSLRKMRTKEPDSLTPTERNLAGSYVFYAYTGIFYSIVLSALVWIVDVSHWSLTIQSLVTTFSWLIIRAIDRIAIPKTVNILAHFYLNGKMS